MEIVKLHAKLKDKSEIYFLISEIFSELNIFSDMRKDADVKMLSAEILKYY